MKALRNLLDQAEPLFHKGGPLEKLYALYEAADTFLYTPGRVTDGPTHVRDGIDLKRTMITVVVALVPCIFMAMIFFVMRKRFLILVIIYIIRNSST